MLSGCSLFEEVNDSLNYVNETSDYINTVTQFAEDAPQMIQDAASDSAVKEELTNELKTIKDEIEQFNGLDAPAIAEDINQQIVNKNEVILEEINKALTNGELALEKLKESELFQIIEDVTGLMNQIENLGL